MNGEDYAQLAWLPSPPEDFREQLRTLSMAETKDGKALRHLASHCLNESQLNSLSRAFLKSLATGSEWSNLTTFKLVLLSNGTSEHLTPILIASALRYGLQLEILSVSYEEAYAEATGGERLAAFAPQAILFAFDYRFIRLPSAYGDERDNQDAVEHALSYIKTMAEGARRAVPSALCLLQSIAMPAASLFGHYDRVIAGSCRRVIEEINKGLADLTAQDGNAICDIAALAEKVGTTNWFDPRSWHGWKMPFAARFLPLYGDHIARLLGAIMGKSRRVLVLDLDNTLWGGVIGDDGVDGILIGNGTAAGEAHLDFQKQILRLRHRGVILTVCSKNEEAAARRPFKELASMPLREDSFAVFHANWNDKAANIRTMAEELSLGLDSFVFVDDNPAERALVRRFLPDVAVPEMPEDPADYASILDAAGYFEAISFSKEDAQRADLYRNKITLSKIDPNNLDGYLKSLNMRLQISDVTEGNRARVVQLINKSNQFNLTTKRLTDGDIRILENDPNCHFFVLRLVDELDDHGIISVILGRHKDKEFDIELWLMSCRVIGRRVEQAVMDLLARQATELRCETITGRYIPTERNQMVEKHYEKMGFTQTGRTSDGTTSWQITLPEAQKIAGGHLMALELSPKRDIQALAG